MNIAPGGFFILLYFSILIKNTLLSSHVSSWGVRKIGLKFSHYFVHDSYTALTLRELTWCKGSVFLPLVTCITVLWKHFDQKAEKPKVVVGSSSPISSLRKTVWQKSLEKTRKGFQTEQCPMSMYDWFGSRSTISTLVSPLILVQCANCGPPCINHIQLLHTDNVRK